MRFGQGYASNVAIEYKKMFYLEKSLNNEML